MGQSEVFPYRRIVADIRADIAAGTRAAGELLPSENDLARYYRASRTTVRRAIAALKAEGLVVSKQGKGAFVRPRPHVRLLLTGSSYRRHRDAGVPGFNAQVEEQGQNPGQLLREVATVNATPDVAERLDLDAGSPVVTRRRLFMIDDEPVAFCDSYYPASMAEGTPIAEPSLIKGGVHRVIEDPNGPIRRHIFRSVDELASRMPTAAEVDVLNLPPGVPVVRVLRTIYDTDERPVEVQCTIAAADRHEFRYEVSMT
ncbi:GntR family transcriptional regulator [Kibdelosporangium aridum]|uniref:GntR family transcriptional regulator n=1 Tax=Kibdelosporangium aridum TaxID=2030 RepID=UPI000526820D